MTRPLVAIGLASTLAGVGACVPSSAGSPVPLTTDGYDAAEALIEPNLQGLVKNAAVEPHWLGDEGSFGYRRDEDQAYPLAPPYPSCDAPS